LQELTPAVRQRVDALADRAVTETLKQEQVNLAGNVTAWLVSCTLLTATEESQLAAQQHAKIAAKVETLPTAAAVQQVFQRLLDNLPQHLKPAEFAYKLTILDQAEPNAFTCGGGYVYLHRSLVASLLAEPKRGPSALAFVMAHELGHVALGHCRRGYQLLKIQEALDRGIDIKVDDRQLKAILKTSLPPAGILTTFLYSRDQEYEADLFALHLCRNAGLEIDHVLDGVRWLALLRYPEIAKDPAFLPHSAATDKTLWYYLSSHPDPLRRLRRLRMDLAGMLDDESPFGLFVWDFSTDRFTKAGAQLIGSEERPWVLVHGLRGSEETFRELLTFLKQQPGDKPRILVFRWPNNGSIAQAATFLQREMGRVVAHPERAVFVSHSAGGLVFRAYAEKLSGGFDRAIFLGTPQGGSDLAACKSVVDMTEFVGLTAAGLPDAIAQTIREGQGQIGYDLHPESLFLRWLGNKPPQAERYYIFAGQCLNPIAASALQLAFDGGLEPLRKLIRDRVEFPWLRAASLRLVDELVLPEEITRGDLVVSVRSAGLEGAYCKIYPKLNHVTIKSDTSVLRQVLELARRR
jgi:Zn-dependent protease with chaperone function